MKRPMILRTIAAALLVACAAAPAGAQQRASVTILQFSDVPDLEPRAPSGDLPNIATVIAWEKVRHPNLIVVHGGNAMSPSPIAALDRGEHMTRLLNQMLVDVMVANIHEFDFGPDVASRRFAELSFPVLGANVMDGGRRAAGLVDGVVVPMAGFRIGFVGGVNGDAPDLPIPGAGRLSFAPLVPALRAAAAAMRAQGAEIVVALCAGAAAECTAALAEPGIDVVLSSAGADPADARSDGRRVLLRSGSQGNVMAAVDLELVRTPRDVGVDLGRGFDPLRAATDRGAAEPAPDRPDQAVTWSATTRLLDTRTVEPDQMIEAITQIELDSTSLAFNERLGTLAAAFSSRSDLTWRAEGSFGDLVTDAMRQQAAADVALLNSGALRGDRDYLEGAPVVVRTVVEELPFSNELVVVTMTGAALRAALEHGLGQLPATAQRFPQVSGMIVRYDPARPAGQRVLSVVIAGRPLDPRRNYRVATSSYVARGGDGYAMVASAPRVAPSGDPPIIRDVVIAYIRRLNSVPLPAAARLNEAPPPRTGRR
jgi:2',3'-cyclic-nucleotide 2'-phosphodiesterase (5'-nucleotidase family)